MSTPFETVFATVATDMLTTAGAFVSDFAPILAAIVGIALGGYTLVVLRRFVG